MDFNEIPVGDEQQTLGSFREYFPGNPANDTTKPVKVYVYLNELEMWCTTEPMEGLGVYLFQTIWAVPATRPITIGVDCTEEIEIGDVFCLDDEDAPNMVRVEYFEDPKPKIVIVIEGGMVRNAYSLTGDSDFAYAIIDLDIPECDENDDLPPIAVTYVVDGTADSVEQIISEL